MRQTQHHQTDVGQATQFDGGRKMSNEYPDVLGDLIESRQRFEVNGVHYMMALQPSTIAPGEATMLQVWLQSCWDVPVQVAIDVHLPTHPAPKLSVIQKHTEVPLEAAEVGQVSIPIATTSQVEPGEHRLAVTIGSKFETRGLYIRSQKNQGQIDNTLLNFTTGLGLAATMGLGFTAISQPEQELLLQVEGTPQALPAPDMTPTYLSHWTVSDLPIQGKARQYVNDQRIPLQPKLTRQALYLAFLEESQARFKDAALPLQIGEAVFLSKVLTYAMEYFLKRPDWQDVVLVPAYVLAYRYQLPVGDPIFLIARADYARVTRLAISLSFGMLRQSLKRDVWSLEEQLAVADLVADRVERGGSLPAEFLYLPLLLGGLLVAAQVTMPGEKPAQSLGLLAQARHKRSADLAENPELVALLDRLLQMAQGNA
jgi:hypothetical protein